MAAMTSFGSVFQAAKRLMPEQSELISEFVALLEQHVDVGAGAEKLFAGSADHEDVNVGVETRVHNGGVQQFQALQRIRIRRRIIQFDDSDAVFGSIFDQCHGYSFTSLAYDHGFRFHVVVQRLVAVFFAHAALLDAAERKFVENDLRRIDPGVARFKPLRGLVRLVESRVQIEEPNP